MKCRFGTNREREGVARRDYGFSMDVSGEDTKADIDRVVSIHLPSYEIVVDLPASQVASVIPDMALQWSIRLPGTEISAFLYSPVPNIDQCYLTYSELSPTRPIDSLVGAISIEYNFGGKILKCSGTTAVKTTTTGAKWLFANLA